MRIASSALVAALVLGACAERSSPASVEHPNVLVICVDTLRADRLAAYGGKGEVTPRIDALAKQGAQFEHAFSHAPWTLPAFASLLTSEVPPSHGAGGKVGDFHALPVSVPTLAEQFARAGYATGAIVNVDFLARPFGVTRGFQDLDARAYEDNENVRAAAPTTDAALSWIRAHRSSAFLLLVHYFDPHAEYRPPVDFRRRFAAPEDREDETFRFGTRRQVVDRRANHASLSPTDVARAECLYDGEVAYVDQEVGRLLDGLSELSLDPTTLVVFTADHGEEFLDHGDWEHGHTLYDELLHVPLILRQTGRITPRPIAATVAHVDVAPTLLDLCGLPACASFQGRSLSPALAGANVEAADVLAFGNFWGPPFSALRQGEYQLILRPDGRRELFRWSSDPAEQHDLAATEAPIAERLQATLERRRAEAVAHGAGPGPSVVLTQAEVRRLSAAGYVGDGDAKKD